MTHYDTLELCYNICAVGADTHKKIVTYIKTVGGNFIGECNINGLIITLVKFPSNEVAHQAQLQFENWDFDFPFYTDKQIHLN